MKKKFIISFVLVLIFVMVGGIIYYNYTYPFEYVSSATYKEDHYIESVSHCGKIPPIKEEYEKDFTHKNAEIIKELQAKYMSKEFKEPIDIRATITVEGGKTTVRYFGTATTEDGVVNYDKSFTVDCVFTRKIPDEFKAEK